VRESREGEVENVRRLSRQRGGDEYLMVLRPEGGSREGTSERA